MLISCRCLNVSIEVKGTQNELSDVDVSTLNLSSEEESCSFFMEMVFLHKSKIKARCPVILPVAVLPCRAARDLSDQSLFQPTFIRELEMSGLPFAMCQPVTLIEELKAVEIHKVIIQVKSLVRSRSTGHWVVEQCLNCSTNCYCTSLDGCVSLVNASLFTHPDAVEKMKMYKDYSPIFRIIVEPLVVEDASHLSDSRHSPLKVQTALTSLQQQLNESIREQVTKTEEKIRLYTEQQYSQLEEFRDRATKDHKALAQKIYDSQLRLDSECVPAESEANEQTANGRVLGRRKTDGFAQESMQVLESKGRALPNRSVSLLAKNSSSTSNSLDSEGLFVLEGMEDSVVNEPAPSEGDSDTDHDDSGSHDEGIDVHRKRTFSVQLAKSLPVNVPVYSVPSTDFDKDEESLGTVDIAASIKALARSVHGDAVFGDLPRPRFSTQI